MHAALAELETAPLEPGLRATLLLLRKLTRDHAITPADLQPVLALGVTRAQLEDAFAVAFAFNVIDRLADTFEFFVPKSFAFSAKILLGKRGYRI